MLMVTDRQALEANIKNTFERCGVGNPKSAESIEDLKQKLSENAGETIFWSSVECWKSLRG
ncbi:hypothetical protein HRED_07237 [Candidatus Haloredivivus sp. G17]|nr:hypothetical protein HRED_07237 [Candidatus Haloredivivus sp. G17]